MNYSGSYDVASGAYDNGASLADAYSRKLGDRGSHSISHSALCRFYSHMMCDRSRKCGYGVYVHALLLVGH